MAKKHLSLLLTLVIMMITHSVFASENDPHEKLNRIVYGFNDVVDRAVLKPVASLYNKIIPKPLNKGLSNVFTNIDTIPTVINDLLQGNFYQTFNDAWRLGINTTVGLGGFFDVATEVGLPYNYNDLGLTFAKYGWRSSNYLVLPFVGPSTVRDGIAWPINFQYLTLYPYIKNKPIRYSLYGTSIVSKRANALRYEGIMDEAALDRYVFMRDAYLQSRNHKIEANAQHVS